MKRNALAVLISLVLLVACLAVGVAAADTVATIGTENYTSLQAAVNAYTDTSVPIVLVADTAENVSIKKDIYLDLNGCSVTGAVTVSTGTLYCMDSQTDDYTIKDTEGYGVLTNVTGDVAGVPVEAECATNGYLMVTEGKSLSFHSVNLQIYAMSLRAENVGLYYKSHFAGDEKVAENVVRYGVALSVKAIPDKDNMETLCEYSTFTGFNVGENGSDATSTLLKNVMKTTNAQLINNRNSKMSVYGRSYILTKDNQYVFGNSVSRSLLEQTQQADSDKYWSGYTKLQKDAVVSMYRNYTPVMRTWEVSNIESALCLDTADPLSPSKEGSLKVLAITSSFGLNTTQLLYDVAVAEGYAPENVTVARLYTSGCTLEKHIKNAPSTPVYQYTKVTGDPTKTDSPGVMQTLFKEGEATLLDGLLDEEWDIIFMQQGAAQAPQLNTYLDSSGQNRIDILRDIMQSYVEEQCPNARFVWNMLWGYQSDSTINPFPTLFNSDQMYMYQCNIDAVMKYVVPRTDYDRIIPTGTVIQNARSSEFGDNLCRDTYHLNNYGGIMAAYGLFAVITGEELTEINIDAVTASNTNGIGGASKITTALTEKQKAIIIESVNNALRNPFSVTESQYPAKDYSSYTYTENLQFIGNTTYAVCPACRAEVSWIEINQDNLSELTSQGYLGTSIAQGTYHFYLSTDIEFTAATASNSFLHAPGGGRNICLHLNGNDLTATNCAISIMAGNAKFNVMGTGTVSGNHVHSSKFRGSAFVLNSGETSNSGTLRLYSGTYIQPSDNTQLAPVSTSFQGGLLEIYEDATIYGNTNSVCLNTANNNTGLTTAYPETVNVYGGTFNRPIYAEAFSTSIANTTLNIKGGTFNSGVEIVSGATVTLSGAPVIKGAGLKLADGITVTLDDLTAGAEIAVDADGAFTVANADAANYLAYFTSANGGKITENNNVLYCQAPSAYAKNLTFEADGVTALCPACGESAEWIEVNQENLSTLLVSGTTGYFGASMPNSGTYHFYLSSDVEHTGTSNSFLHMASNGRNVCLHLNGHNLTATGCAIATLAGNSQLNIMGTGTVSGNHTHSNKFRGSTIILNSGTSTNLGTIRLYSGTYVQPATNTQLAPVSTAQQGGLLELYEDAIVTGNAGGYSVCVNTSNGNSGTTNYIETVNIYGGSFNRPVYCHAFGTVTSTTSLNISGGNFAEGIEIADNTNVTLSGAPVISGSGLKLAEGITVSLDNLTQNASILVDAQGAFTNENALAADYVQYFRAVQSGYSITEADGVLSCTQG